MLLTGSLMYPCFWKCTRFVEVTDVLHVCNEFCQTMRLQHSV